MDPSAPVKGRMLIREVLLAPELRGKGIALPSYFSVSRDYRGWGMDDWVPDILWELQSRILSHFGLSEEQQTFAYLLNLGGRKMNYGRRPVLIPKNLPLVGKSSQRLQAIANNRKDNLGFGEIQCGVLVSLLSSTSSTTKAIAKAIDRIKRESGINLFRLDRSARHPPTHLRNLIILALSEETPQWTEHQVDIQLIYFGLPTISCKTPSRGDVHRRIRMSKHLKVARRDITRKSKKWILAIARSPIFNRVPISLDGS